MSVVKFNRDFASLFNWDTDDNPTTEQDYQNAVKNWTETEMNIVDTLLWQPTTDYTEENVVKTPSLPLHYVLVCTTGGTSGTTEPSYDNVQIGDSVTDGTVEWTVAKLAVTGDIPVVSDRAKVDASNIGVNADTDNSELWGSAIGGGEIAEDDGKLVTGGTVYAVTNGLASDIADNTDDIATNTANISQNATDIGIADKRISNIEKLLQGNLYDYQTDSDAKYVKTVPAGAMPYAGIEKLGGKTVVWNQLVDSGTTSVPTTSGHKYYTLIDGTASIVTSDGTAITIVDDTADMVCDLTLMFGSGNEPSTTADFTAIFGATHYPYNAGTLLSAGVTEVVSKDSNDVTLQTISIPTAIRNLEGYGWSARNVYNYIDYEAKKFIQRVASVDLGSLTFTLSSSALYIVTLPLAKQNSNSSIKGNIVCPKYTTVASGSITGPDGSTPSPDMEIALGSGKTLYINNLSYYRDIPAFTSAMSGVYLYYELATPVETDISAYLTDDNLIQVESGGTLTFPNSNGTDYQIPVPSEEEYMIDLQSAL